MNKLGTGARINLFDESEQTVYDFNKLFPECPLPDHYTNDTRVHIGHYVHDSCRLIHLAGETLTHKMYADLLYGIDRDLFHYDETEKELDEINGVML